MKQRRVESEADVLMPIGDVDPAYVSPKIRYQKSWRPGRWDVPLPVAIAFAAFLYPLLAAPLCVAMFALVELTTAELHEFLAVLLGAPFVAALYGFVLAIPTLLLSTIIWGLVFVARSSLGLCLQPWRVGAQVGAWTTLVWSLLTLAVVEDDLIGVGHLTSEVWITFLLIGPGLATPFAQYVGAWSQWPRKIKDEGGGKPQFGIAQVLVLTAWVAVGLALLKILRLLEPVRIGLLCGWMAYQWVTLRLVVRICRHRYEKRLH